MRDNPTKRHPAHSERNPIMSKNTTTYAQVINASVITDSASADALVATIKAEVNGIPKYAAYVTANGVTRETVKDHAAALVALTYPSLEPVQTKDGKRTKYGNAIQAVAKNLRKALADQDDTTPDAKAKDYLAALIKAAQSAAEKGGMSADQIETAVHTALAEIQTA